MLRFACKNSHASNSVSSKMSNKIKFDIIRPNEYTRKNIKNVKSNSHASHIYGAKSKIIIWLFCGFLLLLIINALEKRDEVADISSSLIQSIHSVSRSIRNILLTSINESLPTHSAWSLLATISHARQFEHSIFTIVWPNVKIKM